MLLNFKYFFRMFKQNLKVQKKNNFFNVFKQNRDSSKIW